MIVPYPAGIPSVAGRGAIHQHRPADPGVPESRKDSIPLSRMCKQQLGSIHAADENLDISAVAEAAAFYKYFVINYR